MPRQIPELSAATLNDLQRRLASARQTRSGRERAEYTIRLVTPMFGGGAVAGQPDDQMPIRASAIRGHLRFWWRATRGAACSSVHELRQREAQIWGSPEFPSPVQVHVSNIKFATPAYQTGPLLGFSEGAPELYALFPLVQSELPEKRLVRADCQFRVSLEWQTTEELVRRWDIENERRIDQNLDLVEQPIVDIGVEILTAFRAWIDFGGLGARTRRGLGCLRITDARYPLPDTCLPPGCQLLLGPKCKDSSEAWCSALTCYREFRQGFRGTNQPLRHKLGDAPHPVYGRTSWPEPDSIRRLTGSFLVNDHPIRPRDYSEPVVAKGDTPLFPRAVLGLPIVFHFKDGPADEGAAIPRRDPATTTLVPDDGTDPHNSSERLKAKGRMASPVIVRPILVGKKWHAGFLILPHAHALALNCRLIGAQARLDRTRNVPADLDQYIENACIQGTPLAVCKPLMGKGDAISGLIEFAKRRGFEIKDVKDGGGES